VGAESVNPRKGVGNMHSSHKEPVYMDGWSVKERQKCSDNIAREAYASTVSPHDLNPAALTELVDALQ